MVWLLLSPPRVASMTDGSPAPEEALVFGVLQPEAELLVLSQEPSPVQLTGIALVVFAGAGAQRGGRRTASTDTPQDQVLVLFTATEPS